MAHSLAPIPPAPAPLAGLLLNCLHMWQAPMGHFTGQFPQPTHMAMATSSAGERTPEGFYACKGGIEAAIARGLAYAPYADLVWFETGEPNFEEAKAFAAALRAKFPGACARVCAWVWTWASRPWWACVCV